MTDSRREQQAPYLLLDWQDIQEMLAGHHPLVLFQMALQEEATYNPPVRLESGDYLENAEYLCKSLRENGLHLSDIREHSIDLFRATEGLTNVSDSVLKKIITLVAQKKENKSRGVLRKSGLVDPSTLKPIQRKTPIQRGANYGDPENKAFPLDTPERVKAAHAYLHKAWQNNGTTGVTSSYGRPKFLKVHKRIVTRMRSLGLQHSAVDTLDSATRRKMKQDKLAKASLKAELAPEIASKDDVNRLQNVLEVLFTEHITFLKNYIIAKDENNEAVAQSMQGLLVTNGESILGFVNESLLTEDSDVYLLKQFSSIWQEYIDAAVAMSLSGDTDSENMKKDSERELFIVKDKIVSFIISLVGDVAEQDKLNSAFTDWMTYLQQYIETRDDDDFAASYQNLKDWQKSKSIVAGLIAKWVVQRDALAEQEVNPDEIEERSELNEPVSDQPRGQIAGGLQPGATQAEVTNPPAPMNNQNPHQPPQTARVQDAAAASPAAPAPASNTSPTTATSYPPNTQPVSKKPQNMGSGHKPYRNDCDVDRRSGKCYRRHEDAR